MEVHLDHILMLKKMVCLLSCQPRNLQSQLNDALDCLLAATSALATGILWPDANGSIQLRAQSPLNFFADPKSWRNFTNPDNPDALTWGQEAYAWLAAPMKVGGTPIGRLWVVDHVGRNFDQNDREFIMMAGNQLALAIENSRLYEEVQRLAIKRGELLRRVIATQDERCRRISRELHDEISQSLTAMSLDIEAIDLDDQLRHHPVLQRLSHMRPRLQTALKEINRIILDLRPTLLDDMGLIAAIRWFAMQRLGTSGVNVHIDCSDPAINPESHVETTLYRIAQEAINNIARHAHARNVWLSYQKTNHTIQLSIRDDGCGFDPEAVMNQPDDRKGIGLFGMQERASVIGACTEINSAPGQGTCILVRYPAREFKAG